MTPDGHTPLTTAAGGTSHGLNLNISALALLLDRGAGINVPDKTGRTPLMAAARCGHTEVA